MSWWRRVAGLLPKDQPWPSPRFDAPAAAAAKAAQRNLSALAGGALGRMYASAMHSATSTGFGGMTSSADAELRSSLPMLRSRSRQMMRDAAYAKRARKLVCDNVIGSGVGMQAQVMTTRGGLNGPLNEAIEQEWEEWCSADSCHTGGALHFGDLERAAMAQVFEAGEAFIRVHLRAFGRSRVPLALELVEAERVADQIADAGVGALRGELRMGVEVDQFQRALRYWIRRRHPGDMYQPDTRQSDLVDGVPASEVFHLRVIDRWPQTRGEPWLHTALRKIDDLHEVTGLEVQAARGSAAFFATIESDDDAPLGNDSDDQESDPVVNIDPMTVQHLDPGKKLAFHQPSRPNVNLDPFVRFMLREVAAAAGTSYESLSRDYSQSNYSSSRLALLDDRDTWRVLQAWWIRNFRLPLHRLWMQQAALAGAVSGLDVRQYAADPRKFEAVKFKARGWSWVDPTKEVTAYKEAVKAGFTTVSDVISQTAGGQDLEDVLATRQRELAAMAEAGVVVDTTMQAAAAGAQAGQAGGSAGAQGAIAPDDGDGDTPSSAAARNAGGTVVWVSKRSAT